MLNVNQLSKSYGTRRLFSGMNLNIGMKDRIGVVGQNGAGKTTLFEIIAGNVTPDTGSVSMHRGTTIGYLRQDAMAASEHTVLKEVAGSSTDMNNLAHKIELLNDDLAGEKDEERIAAMLEDLGELQTEFESTGGYDSEHRARVILSGMGFAESDLERPVSEFSGGWRTRAELAKLLFINPDLLILDEPTNHLDLETIRWFENYLQHYRGAVLVTSHDRAFLNNVVKKILAFDRGEVIFFNGSYDDFVVAREKDLELRQAMAKRQELAIKKEMRFIERFRAKATKAAQVQSRIKKLEKIEKIVVPRTTKKVDFSFPEPARSGRSVITLDGISKSYGTKLVYNDLNMELERGDKAAIVGPNGAGKTTLLKILAGVLPFERGTRTLGHNVTSAYFAQYYIELLNPVSTILEELRHVAPDMLEQQLRGILGIFLFSGDDVNKKISVLSGGEKTRVAIARMLTKPANLLLLDEPTNHLDIPSREILADALQAYSGTLCVITHDRTLIREVANKIVEVQAGKVRSYPGSYDDYLYTKERSETPGDSRVEERRLPSGAGTRSPVDTRRQRQISGELRNRFYRKITPVKDRIAGIEEEMSRINGRTKELENLLADPDHYKQGRTASETAGEYQSLKDRAGLLTGEWERLTAESDALSQEFEREMRELAG